LKGELVSSSRFQIEIIIKIYMEHGTWNRVNTTPQEDK